MEQSKQIDLPPGEDEFYGLSEEVFRNLTHEQLQGYRDIHALALKLALDSIRNETILGVLGTVADANRTGIR